MLNRREFIAGGALAGAPLQAARKPNILHLMSDQQQWGTIAGRTECRTPSLNRLAAGGMLFERSYTPSAVCCPARAMMLSGAYHWHNGVFNQVHSAPSVHRDMFPDVVLYSQRLREAGYHLGYAGKWHASQIRNPLDFGYHEYLPLNKYLDHANPKGAIKTTPLRRFRWPGSEPFIMWGYREGPEEATPEYRLADDAIEMMNRFAKLDQPWEIEVQYLQPHDAYMPLKKYLDRYDPRAIKVPGSFRDTFQGKPGLHRRESETWGEVSEEDYRQSRACYYAYVEELDAQIGRILDALDKTGQAENTLVVYTTDHGDMVGAHRMWSKGWMPYEECYRVPLIARWPGRIKPGSRSSHLVQTHDLAHTYVEAAGAGKMPYADGRALEPLFDDPGRADWADEIMCAYYGGEFLYTQRIAITDRYKYVFNGFDIDELYDLREDPEEMRNVAYDPKYRAQADDMRARLYDMMRKSEDPFGDVKPRNDKYGNAPDRYGAPRYLARGKRI
jgi:arylsulfatase A-like enzyme